MGNLRSIIIFDKLKTCYHTTSTNTSYFLSSIVDYWYDRHNKWVFIPNYTLPIPLQHIKNDVYSDWLYHSSTNTLKSYHASSTYELYKVNWLSAQISIRTLTTSNEFNIDDFLSDFMVYSTVDLSDHNMIGVPKITYLFISWCIYTKQWFPSDAEVVFHIIDSNGVERDVQVHEHNYVEIAPKHF